MMVLRLLGNTIFFIQKICCLIPCHLNFYILLRILYQYKCHLSYNTQYYLSYLQK